MTRERVIWRPNSIPPNVWEAMSREDQIAWWKGQPKEPPQPKQHMTEAISLYDKGQITLGDFALRVYELAASNEIEEFMAACPPDLLAALKESLACYGDDESTWPQVFYSACHAPWITPEEIEESRRRVQQRIWDGVRILKKWGQVPTIGRS